MTTIKRPSHVVPSHALARSGPERRPAQTRAEGSRPVLPQPGIIDAVRDQHDGLWVRYGTRERSTWIAVPDFAHQEVFKRLANIDPRLIEAKAQHRLRSEVAQTATFRPALVAAAPGWTGHHFVFGDGYALAPRIDRTEIIVTFTPQPKFEPRGTLAGWQAGIGPIVAGQPLALFALALAFVGPLMPFVPPDYLSPLFEFVGPPGTGKSTIAFAGMSAWAGDCDSIYGGAETWDRTPSTIDIVKLDHRHILLVLDEANLAGKKQQERCELIQKAIFGLSNSGARQRYGEETNKPHAQLAVLSTTNRRLGDLIEGSDDERGAVLERMITIEISRDRAYGALDHLPPGFEDAAEAVEALRAAIDEQWGTAGPAFVDDLQNCVAQDEDHIRDYLARRLAHYRQLLSAVTDVARVQKCFALVCVAGSLAQRWDILPKQWGCPVEAVLSVAREAVGNAPAPASDPATRLRDYREAHRAKIYDVARMSRPLSRRAFEAAYGFLQNHYGRPELLVPAQQFQNAFPDYRQLMRGLRERGDARTEGGQNSKLTIKTPRAICAEGRVYCIALG